MKKQHHSTSRLVRGTLGTLAVAFGLVSAGHGSAYASSGTAANATITNMVKVDYFDANGKGLNGTTAPIEKSASTQVTVTLLAATPSIGAPTPTPVATVDSGAVQTYDFKVWSNANGKDNYKFDVSALSPNTNTTSSDRYIAAVKNAAGVTTAAGSGTLSTNLNIGAVTVISNTASTVSIPFGTMAANLITVGDTIKINGAEYKVDSINNAGAAAAYDSTTNTLTAEVPIVLNITAVDGSAANLPTASGGLAGLPLSQQYVVTVAVTATGDPTAAKGTACFTDTFASLTDASKTVTNASSCTDFRSSNLSIVKSSDVPQAQPNATVTYTITVNLPVGAANSTKVKVADAVPVYTTLKTGTYGAGTFARVTKSTDGGTTWGTPVNLTVANDNTEDATTASGDAAGTAANAALTFYLGNGNVGTGTPVGGTIAAGEKYKIEYQVTVN